jgi:hypothetical protein
MHDHVAGVDQNPVAVRQPLHACAAVAVLLQRAQNVVGDCAHVPVRTAGGDDHGVGHRALVSQIDLNDVLGLVVFKPGQDQPGQVLDGAGQGGGRLGRAGPSLERARRNNAIQLVTLLWMAAYRCVKPSTPQGRGQEAFSGAPSLSRARMAVDDAKLSGAVR